MNDDLDSPADLKRWAEDPIHGARNQPEDPDTILAEIREARQAEHAKLVAADERFAREQAIKWQGTRA